MASDPQFLFGYDFYYLWSAGKIAAQGGNPYDSAQFHSMLASIGWPASEQPQQITHFPWIFWLYILFSILPFSISLGLWTGFICAASVGVLVCLLKKARILVGHELPWAETVFAFLLFPPLWGNILYGQIDILIAIGVIGSVILLRDSRPFLSGCVLSFSLAKPHLLLPFYACLCILSFKRSLPRLPIGVACGFFLQLFGTLLMAPELLYFYWNQMSTIMSDSAALTGASVGQAFDRILGVPILRIPLMVVGIVAAVRWSLKHRSLNSTLLRRMVPLSFVTTPYVWSHSFLVLLAPYLATSTYLLQKHGRSLRFALALGSLLWTSLLFQVQFEPLWCLFPLALLFAPPFTPNRKQSKT